MQLGISSYSYTWAVGVPGQMPEKCLSAAGLVDKAVQLNVPVVQIADNLPLHSLPPDRLKALLVYANKRKIRIEVGTRGLTRENVETYVAIAKMFQSPILRVVVDAKGFEPSTEECIATIRGIIPLLKDSGVKLAIENHDRFRAGEFARMITETDPEWTGICLDSVNSMGAGEGIEEVVKTLAPFTVNLHLKEFSVRRAWHMMGFVVEGLPAGQGMLDIPWLLDEIGKYGKCETAILELWTPPEEDLDRTIQKEEQWVNESIRFLKPLFEK